MFVRVCTLLDMQGFNKSVRCLLPVVQSTDPVSDTILQITIQNKAVSTSIEVSLHHLPCPVALSNHFNRQTCPGRQSPKVGSGHSDRPLRTSLQHLVVSSLLVRLKRSVFSATAHASGTCNNHIGMGVRYNAEKKKIGNYYSTPIYSFRCKCHLCDGWFEIHTDPKV